MRLLLRLGRLGELVRRHPHVVEDIGQLPGVDAAAVSHVALTSLMHVDVARLAFQALPVEAVEERAAVIAPRETFVVVNDESMGNVDFESRRRLRVLVHFVGVLLDPRALGRDELVATFVHDAYADLTLVALFAEAPDEVAAVAAERGLPEERRHELVTVDLMDAALHRASSLFVSEAAFLLFEFAFRGHALLLSRPLQLDLRVKFTIGFEVHLEYQHDHTQ